MIDDPELIDQEIQKKKQERKKVMEEIHELKMRKEEINDEIRELEDLKTEAKTLKKVRSKIPESQLQQVRDTVRVNKYDSDPRSADPEDVVKHNAERLASKFDVEEGKIEQVLRVTTDL